MKFLIDNAVSPQVSAALRDAGHDSVHVRDLAMQAAPDGVVFELAEKEGRIVVSADTDFGTLLALRGVLRPSVILFRHGAERDPERQAALLLSSLVDLEAHLLAGAMVTIEPTRIRIRQLPFA